MLGDKKGNDVSWLTLCWGTNGCGGTNEGTLFSCADNWEFRGCRKSQFAPFKQEPLLLKKGQATSFFGSFVIRLLMVWRELTGSEPSQESSNLISELKIDDADVNDDVKMASKWRGMSINGHSNHFHGVIDVRVA